MFFFEKNGLSLASIGIVLSAFQVSKLLFEIPTGVIADRYGKKSSVTIGFILGICSLILMVILQNYYSFFIGMCISGLAYTFCSGALDSILIDNVIRYDSALLSKTNQISRILYYVAIATSSILGGIVATYSYDLVFWITIGIQIGSTIIFSIFIEDDSHNRTFAHDKSELFEKQVGIKPAFDYLYTNKKYIHLILIGVFVSVSMIPIDSYYSIFLYSQGLSTVTIGCIIAIQFTFSSFIGLILERYIKNFSDQLVVLIFPLTMMVAFLGFAIVSNTIIRILLYFLGLLIFCLYAPRVHLLLHSHMQHSYRATILSIDSLLKSLCAIFVQPIFGKITEQIGYSLSFSCLIVASICLLISNSMHLRKYLS